MADTRADLKHAAELLGRLLPRTTPGPWRDSTVDSNRYGALVTTGPCVRLGTRGGRSCDQWHALHPEWGHPHDGYGGCLVAESMTPEDRRLLAVMRNVADHLPDLLLATAHEDPVDLGRVARTIARAVIDTHTPQEPQ